MAPNPSFLPPSQISSAGGVGNPFSGNGMVATAIPPRQRQFPWPLPFSAEQGGVGGAGGLGVVAVSLPPYYGPFLTWWPYQVPRLNGLPNSIIKS